MVYILPDAEACLRVNASLGYIKASLGYMASHVTSITNRL